VGNDPHDQPRVEPEGSDRHQDGGGCQDYLSSNSIFASPLAGIATSLVIVTGLS
jgi:hypothetical protein